MKVVAISGLLAAYTGRKGKNMLLTGSRRVSRLLFGLAGKYLASISQGNDANSNEGFGLDPKYRGAMKDMLGKRIKQRDQFLRLSILGCDVAGREKEGEGRFRLLIVRKVRDKKNLFQLQLI